MQITFPHKGTRGDAKARIDQLLKTQAKEIEKNAEDVKTEWSGDVMSFEFTARGTHITGTLTVTDTDYEVYAKLPLSLRLFEGTIEKMIEKEVAKLKI